MADLVSPGVQVKEKDLTASVRSEPTSIGAGTIVADWGPMNEVITISDETQLVDIFGKPNVINYEYWFSAANFLNYTSTLRLVRMETTGVKNAGVSGTAVLIPNTTSYEVGDGTQGPFADGSANVGQFAARFPGSLGNSLKVSACWTGAGYSKSTGAGAGATGVVASGGTLNTVTVTFGTGEGANWVKGDIMSFPTIAVEKGQKYSVVSVAGEVVTIKRYPVVNAVGFKTTIPATTVATKTWQYYDQFDAAPATTTWCQNMQQGATTGLDEMHIIVVDEDGDITGVSGTILEKYESLSKFAGAVTDSGDNNYWWDAIYIGSSYIYVMDDPAGTLTNWGVAPNPDGTTAMVPTAASQTSSLSGGIASVAPTDGERMAAFDRFEDPDEVDMNLLIAGPASVNGASSTTLAVDLIDLVEKRKDAVVFLSPHRDAVVKVANSYTQATNVTTWADLISSSSYAVIDSGYKKMYDKYNDVFRWVPLGADIAGCCARTDAVEDAWWSPGGLNRGQIRGAVELAFNPTQTQRDELYRKRVNPVVTFPGEGTVLWGDKTALSQNSAFSRINVRRLFITIEEAIAKASRTVLFEFNDTFTRENFLGMVNPYMRDVMARRGVTDFLVVCDETNNTGQVIDNNEFRADIYVKPARSINFITLTFVATRTDVAFSEVVGRA